VEVRRTRNLNRQAGTVGVRRCPTVIRHNLTSDYVGLHGNGSETGESPYSHQVSKPKPPSLVLANAQFPYHLRVTNLHPPLPRTALQCRFIQRTQNRATNTRFRVFGLNPTPGFALANSQPPWRLHAIHPHPPSPIIAPHRCFTQHARNRATNAWFRVFGLNPTPASHWRMRCPPGISMPSTHTHHLPSLPRTTVSHGMPETELQTLSFRFLA
jgi:hypothetical protein